MIILWKNGKKKYPKELILTSDDKNNQSVDFLDLHIEIKAHNFISRLYDKRDKFKFKIINFPCLSGRFQPNSHTMFLLPNS